MQLMKEEWLPFCLPQNMLWWRGVGGTHERSNRNHCVTSILGTLEVFAEYSSNHLECGGSGAPQLVLVLPLSRDLPHQSGPREGTLGPSFSECKARWPALRTLKKSLRASPERCPCACWQTPENCEIGSKADLLMELPAFAGQGRASWPLCSTR